MLRVLLLEDSPLDAELTISTLKAGGIHCQTKRVERRDEYINAIRERGFDVILADYALPDFDGVSALRIAAVQVPDIPFIFVSGSIGEELAIESLKQGATDYVLKERLVRLVPCVNRALRETHDRRDRKRAEEALMHNEKIAMLGRLAATVAHEINNPLSSVTNVLYLLSTQPELTNDSRILIEMAQTELKRVAEISHQTLSFYRESPHAVPIDIAELLEGVLWLFDRQIREKDMVVERRVEYRKKFPAFPGELRQALCNLVSNAIQAIPPNGRMVLRVHETTRRNTGERGLSFIIADSGGGIAPEDRFHIFEPFFSTKGENGTGLGLWVTKGVVEKHRGTIRMRSRQGENSGTTFSIFLPFQQEVLPLTENPRKPVVDAVA
ncbi:response regulator receiver sensor signal transduction histidine kinase [Candidatus Koribacter versatilis Ellin345]|uniref:histidine kinase n=1 Tax=Koribacter versatilis (strain Ellin345) TaxID=204669 RepID=Q1IQN5_KORVE|nr:hybrid sensor histidine kinase/response regulator [Candidatus Koribacter versatilis]ABF40815.1 response regulator receiver sensor signal transduction histidine kinase [Candidatus Koribacter versatilis Ellin345]